MSAQLEDGYTRTANELMERLMKIKLNGTQHNIVYCIIRNTYGFQRKSHPMSLSFISTAIETHKDLIKRELDKLIESKIVRVFKEATFNDPREIGMNKNVSDWKVDSKPISRQSTKQSTVDQSVYPQSPNQSSPSVDGLVYQERKVFKESLKESTDTTNPPEIILQDEFCRIHAKGSWNLKQGEYKHFAAITSCGIPMDFIISTMTQMHDLKKSKNEKVTSFSFYYESIIEAWNAKKGVIPLERSEQGNTGVHGKPAKSLTEQFAISG